MFSLWDDLKSLEPSWTAEGFGCSLLPPSGSEPCCLKATDTCFSPNLVDYCSWHRPAGAAVFVDLMELPLHEITQLTEMGKQQLQPRAQSPLSFFFWAASFSIVALWRRMESVHLCRTSPAGLR